MRPNWANSWADGGPHDRGALCFGIWLGDELGLYRTLDGSGPMTADEVAGKAGCNPRLVREWLDGQVGGGLINFDPKNDTYELGPEAGEARLRDVFTEAGFTNFRRAAETPMNLILEARA